MVKFFFFCPLVLLVKGFLSLKHHCTHLLMWQPLRPGPVHLEMNQMRAVNAF